MEVSSNTESNAAHDGPALAFIATYASSFVRSFHQLRKRIFKQDYSLGWFFHLGSVLTVNGLHYHSPRL